MTAVRRWLAAVLGAVVDWLAERLDRLDPPSGHHAPIITQAPAPVAEAQEPRPGDPRAATRAVRAGARTPTAPNPMTPAVPVPPSGQPEAAPSPARPAPSPAPTGEGAPPGRDTWVIRQPPPGSPLGYMPVNRAPRHAATSPLTGQHPFDAPPYWGISAAQRPEALIVVDGSGPYAVIPRPGPVSTRTTGILAALGDLPPVPVRRCSTDVAVWGADLIAGLRAL